MDFKSLMRPHMKDISPYIPGKPIEEVRRELDIEGEIIKLASNENPYPPIPEILRAIQEESGKINRYPNSGSHYLCNDIAGHIGIESSRIFVGNGSNEILDLLVRGFVNPDEEVIIPYPSFIAYPLIIHLAGVKEVKVPLKDYRLDLKAMKEKITGKTKMVFICNPNNPTATYVSGEEVAQFMDGIRDDILVVFDEAYYEYVTAEDYPQTVQLLESNENIVILRTFSKVYSLSGLRVGYSISDPELVTCLHMVRQPFNVNRIAQAGARAALKYSGMLEERVGENARQLKLVSDELRKYGFTVPESQTNFILAIPPEGMVRDLVGKLLSRGVIVRGMSPFGLGSEAIRVTIGTPDENSRFLRELREIIS
ncbi:MAG: histidinol-phosphate transaminase [Candidatus Latescibacteria bacterium]|nr:histidinol-phosphate transaminase [bacterium]MBD3425110.1 histidinol-phosphate transaminase [Candidatus Latescibacterota bacterium]